MKISERMERALLDYFAKDDGDDRAFQSLTTIYEKIDRPSEWRESFFSDLPGIDDKEQLRTILDQMVVDGLLQRDWATNDYESSYRATEQGIYESVLGMDGYVSSDPSIKPITIDAEEWTGEQAIVLNGKVWRTVRARARDLQSKCRTTNFQSEEDRRDIQGLADALVALCEMAEPEVTIIDKITAHPKFKAYAALAVFVATIRGALGV